MLSAEEIGEWIGIGSQREGHIILIKNQDVVEKGYINLIPFVAHFQVPVDAQLVNVGDARHVRNTFVGRGRAHFGANGRTWGNTNRGGE